MRKIIEEKVRILNEARRAYEQEDIELMTNAEYDALYDELEALEKKTGIILPDSPVHNVGYEVMSELPKERHPKRMLSLDKTKDIEVLKDFIGDRKGILSWKVDGITTVLTYENGILTKAVTRGNGDIGEVITSNARTFRNLPKEIPFKGRLVLRGEAHITYSRFEYINSTLEDVDAKYKNPRNLCSGTVRQLDSSVAAKRGVDFLAFTLVEADGVDFRNSRDYQLTWLSDQGFAAVERKMVTRENVAEAVKWYAGEVRNYDIPSDGLVFTFDDIEYGQSLGETSKYPRDAIAFKWQDETAVTKLIGIEWSPSRTGLINPVAVFEPVQLEGTSVSRASVHNLSIMQQLKLGEGDEIEVYKANMIIPQVLRNNTGSGTIVIPDTCPVCGGRTKIREDNDARVLVCMNPDCQAKHVKGFAHFASRDAMNIDGMSEQTIEKFVSRGFIRTYADFFRLDRYKDEISSMEGFGEKSCRNILASCDAARKTDCARLLYGLGVPNFGTATAKTVAKACGYDWDKIVNLTREDLMGINGIGDVMAGDFADYFADGDNRAKIEELLSYIEFEEAHQADTIQDLEGKTFVITGSLNSFANRDALKKEIEDRGGKVAGSVSSRTSYLINNDSSSSSSKNRKARELGIPVITEEEFLEM